MSLSYFQFVSLYDTDLRFDREERGPKIGLFLSFEEPDIKSHTAAT